MFLFVCGVGAGVFPFLDTTGHIVGFFAGVLRSEVLPCLWPNTASSAIVVIHPQSLSGWKRARARFAAFTALMFIITGYVVLGYLYSRDASSFVCSLCETGNCYDVFKGICDSHGQVFPVG